MFVRPFQIIVLLAAPYAAEADQDLFACLDGAGSKAEDFLACSEPFIDRCLDAGETSKDLPPQTACLMGAATPVTSALNALDQINEKTAKDLILAASLRRELRIADVECAYLREMREMRKELEGVDLAYNDALCLASSYPFAYWRVVVHEFSK